MTALWRLLGPPLVVDLFHGSNNDDRAGPIDFARLYADGVRLVIHKATQGAHIIDPLYAKRRVAAIDAGLLFDAYHFATSDDLAAQLAHFLAVADPDPLMRLALDCEPNHGASITYGGADTLAAGLDDKRGRQCWRYTGAGFLTPGAVAMTPHFRNGPLWWAKYGPQPTQAQLVPMGIDKDNILLWQASDHGIRDGITGAVDQSHWIGTAEELAAYPTLPQSYVAVPPIHPLVRLGAENVAVAELQRRLAVLGFDPGPADQRFGRRTDAAVRALQTQAGIAVDGIVGDSTWNALAHAEAAAHHDPA